MSKRQQDKFTIYTCANFRSGLGHVTRSITLGLKLIERGYVLQFCSLDDYVRIEADKNRIPFTLCSFQSMIQKIEKEEDTIHIIDFPEYMLVEMLEDFNPLKTSKVAVLFSSLGLGVKPFGHLFISIGDNLEHNQIVKGYRPVQCSGRDFIIFREEFNKSFNKEIKESARNVLIAMGGSDPCNIGLRVIQMFEDFFNDYNITIVIGKASNAKEKIVSVTKIQNKNKYYFRENVTKISDDMYWADLAIINGGNVRYELCRVGTPFIAISMHKNQFLCSEQIARIGAGVNIGVHSDISDIQIANVTKMVLNNFQLRQKQSNIMKSLFGVKGLDNIIDKLELLNSGRLD